MGKGCGHVQCNELAVSTNANVSKSTSRVYGYLDTLVTGTSRHSPAVKIIRNIVDEIFMIGSDTTCYKHDCVYNIPEPLATLISQQACPVSTVCVWRVYSGECNTACQPHGGVLSQISSRKADDLYVDTDVCMQSCMLDFRQGTYQKITKKGWNVTMHNLLNAVLN